MFTTQCHYSVQISKSSDNCQPVNLIDFPTITSPPSTGLVNSSTFTAPLTIEFDSEEIDITALISSFIQSLEIQGLSGNSFLTTNADFCNGTFSAIEEEFEQTSGQDFFNIWFHVWDNPESDEDCLYIKGEHFISEGLDMAPPDPDLTDIEMCNCSEGQRDTLLLDHLGSLAELEIAINKLEEYDGEGPLEVKYALEKYFHDSPSLELAEVVKRKLQIIRRGAATARYKCNTEHEGLCAIPAPYTPSAYTFYFSYNVLTKTKLCPGYFSRELATGYGGRYQTLIHEHVHSYLGGIDYAYDHDDGFEDLPPHQALGNPDSFAAFVVALVQEDFGHPFPVGPLIGQIFNSQSTLESAFNLDEDTPILSSWPDHMISLELSPNHPFIGMLPPTLSSRNGTQFVSAPSWIQFDQIGITAASNIFDAALVRTSSILAMPGLIRIAKKDDSYYVLMVTVADSEDPTCICDYPGRVEFIYKRTE